MLKMRPSPLRAAAIAALLALAAAFVAPFASAQGAGYWHTSGNKILDSNGTEVRMAGINWYGFETPDFLIHGLWAQDYHTVLSTIKSLGFNVIRIPFSNQMVESNPVPTNFTQFANGGTVNQALVGATALQDLDTIVSTAGSMGLRVILDNHRSEAGSSNEASGLWYTSAYPQANWIADWQTLATRYSASQFTFNGNPTVIGMDLRNEPHLSGSGATTGSCWTGDTATNGCPVTLTTQNWPVAATAAGNAILAINPKLLIFIEGNDCYSGVCGWQGGNLIGVASNPVTLSVPNQLVYSAHDYGPNLFQQPWFNSSTTPASLDAIWTKYWAYISAAGTAPVWVGEFGTDNTSTDIENTAAGSQGQWFESLVSFLQSNPQLNWTNWALNGEDEYALLDSNYDATPVSSLKLSELQSIQFPLGGGTTPTPGFTLTPSAGTVSVAQGASTTDSITVTDTGGFTGAVTLTAASNNTGVTASVSGDTITIAASSTATGTATITVTGTSGSGSSAITANTTITVTVTPTTPAGFTLAPASSSVSVAAGSSTTDAITVTDTGGFTGAVTLTAASSNSGVTASVSGTTVTIAASSTATGTATITVTGTSGSITETTMIAVTVTGAPSFSLTPASSSVSVTQGSSATDAITVTDVNGFSSAVALTATSNNAGVTATVSGTTVTIAASSTATGTATISVTGTSGSITATTSIAVTVNPSTPAGFTLTPASTSVSVTQGSSTTDAVTVTDTGGFSGAVTLTAASNNTGVTATVSGDTITIAASATATGTATITVTGTSGATTASTSIAVTVNPTTSGNFCHIVYTINSQWPGSPGGFGVGLTIENTSTTAWTSWTLTWSFANGQTVAQLWNGSETQSGANVTVNNLSYDGSIPAGGNLNSVGFNGTWNGTTNAAPTAFTVNGHACN